MELREDNRLYQQIGEFLIKSPVMPVRDKFLNGSVKEKKKQKFEHTVIPTPSQWKRMPLEEQVAFEDREWDRRMNGAWFYNNGQPTWISGVHYFLLNYVSLDTGAAKYRDSDRKFFWVWHHVVTSRMCEGLLNITKRRDGKSTRGGTVLLEAATNPLNTNKHLGIQSKSDDDAKKLFKRAVVFPWRKLPQFFSPKYSNSNNPEKEIRFEAPAKKGKGATTDDGGIYQEAELGNWIDFANSKENAYDGEKIFYFLNDEIFKKQLYCPVKRWSIVRKMMQEGGEIIGKSLHTSSVGEEIEETGVERANEFWKDSDTKKLDANGQTVSGLFRYFQPAYEGHMIDEYGLDRLEESKAFFMARRQNFINKNDHAGLLGEKRSNPFTVEEALLPDGKGGVYNQIALSDTVDKIKAFTNATSKEVLHPYKLKFADAAKTRVVAIPDPEGRFLFSWMPPDAGMLNRVTAIGQTVTQFGLQTKYAPLNDVNFGIGVDPIDKRKVTDMKTASMFSAHAMWKLDPMNEQNKDQKDYWPSGSFICQYSHRINNETMYEDMILLAHYLGCSMLFENQKCKIADHFRNRGYEAFLAFRPDFTQTNNTNKGDEPGIPSSPMVIGKYVELTQDFIEGRYEGDPDSLAADWRRCPFESTVNQWLHFDPENTKKFDEAVSASFTLLHCLRYMPMAPAAESVEDFELDM